MGSRSAFTGTGSGFGASTSKPSAANTTICCLSLKPRPRTYYEKRSTRLVSRSSEISHSSRWAKPISTQKVTAVLQRTDGSLEQFECSYLIDAEGAYSIARGTVGVHFQGKSHVEARS